MSKLIHKLMKHLGILMIVTALTSCVSSKYMISPPFTSTDEITALKKGMTKSEVETTLGITSYDILSLVDNDLWVTYNYRVKNLITPITSFSQGLDNAGENKKPTNVDDIGARNIGEIQYGDWGTLYVLFSDGSYASSFSELGVDKSNDLVTLKSSIKNHVAKGPVFLVNDKAYIENENGVLQSVDFRRFREAKRNNKQQNK
jgi:hypothetical protein